MPDLWPLFEGLKPFPVLSIRGANSDLLTAETLQAMQERHPRLTALTVPDEGHAPSLEGRLIQSISQFILEVEASA
jgi:pimeloyl-ACP methyl ester carboxylesterase